MLRLFLVAERSRLRVSAHPCRTQQVTHGERAGSDRVAVAASLGASVDGANEIASTAHCCPLVQSRFCRSPRFLRAVSAAAFRTPVICSVYSVSVRRG